MNNVAWKVLIPKALKKNINKLPTNARIIFDLFLEEIKMEGPWRNSWPNYGKLAGKGQFFHCHLKKGKPTYVVCWEILDKKIRILEIKYVGTHEKAPY